MDWFLLQRNHLLVCVFLVYSCGDYVQVKKNDESRFSNKKITYKNYSRADVIFSALDSVLLKVEELTWSENKELKTNSFTLEVNAYEAKVGLIVAEARKSRQGGYLMYEEDVLLTIYAKTGDMSDLYFSVKDSVSIYDEHDKYQHRYQPIQYDSFGKENVVFVLKSYLPIYGDGYYEFFFPDFYMKIMAPSEKNPNAASLNNFLSAFIYRDNTRGIKFLKGGKTTFVSEEYYLPPNG